MAAGERGWQGGGAEGRKGGGAEEEGLRSGEKRATVAGSALRTAPCAEPVVELGDDVGGSVALRAQVRDLLLEQQRPRRLRRVEARRSHNMLELGHGSVCGGGRAAAR